MRRFRLIILLISLACISSWARDLSRDYDSAQALYDDEEYLVASKQFADIAGGAIDEKDYLLYMQSLVAEGECCYALNLTSDVLSSLNNLKQAFAEYGDKIQDNEQRLLLEEAMDKLEGSYYSLMYETDNSYFAKADEAYMAAARVITRLKNETYFDDEELNILLQRDRINLYYAAKKYDEALTMANEVCDFYFDRSGDADSKLVSERRAYRLYIDAFSSRAMIEARLNQFDVAISDIKQLSGYRNNPRLQRIMGKILMMQGDKTGVDNRAEAKRCYAKYISYIKSYLAKNLSSMSDAQREKYWLSMHDFLFDCYRLENFAPDMLYDLALYAKGYLNNKHQYKWQDISRKLSTDACAIEFVQYNGVDDKKQLGAIVLSRKSKPTFIHIADVEEFESLNLRTGRLVGEAMRNDYGLSKDALYGDSTLFARIWTDDLMQAIGSSPKIYFAADGILHILAIEYMMPDSTKECHRLSSTRVLMNPPKFDMSCIAVCGGVNYGTAVSESNNGDNDEVAYRKLVRHGGSFNYLPGTATEIDSIIGAIATLKANTKIDVLRDSAATDVRFCDAAQQSSVVHLSTHGFFIGTITGSDVKPAITDNSLSESGLAFAGVNANLLDANFDATRNDGIVTAKELSTKDLANVQFVVLSACQTGLGYLTDDGVCGMQRGLKMAGVGAMALSLWSVDDFATCELMKRFYKELATDGQTSVYDAFMKARRSMISDQSVLVTKFSAGSLSRKKVKTQINKPQYFNAFILVDVL